MRGVTRAWTTHPVCGLRTAWDLTSRRTALVGRRRSVRLLDRYGIPFFYEMPTVIYDRVRYRVWRPDFTLPTYGNLIVEYAGMMDVRDYAAGIRHKKRAYAANAMQAMFVYPAELRGRSWPRRIAQRIEYFGRLSGSRHYNARPRL
jgi:hypothetical protein